MGILIKEPGLAGLGVERVERKFGKPQDPCLEVYETSNGGPRFAITLPADASTDYEARYQKGIQAIRKAMGKSVRYDTEGERFVLVGSDTPVIWSRSLARFVPGSYKKLFPKKVPAPQKLDSKDK
jgi:hypothetical protein